MAYKLGITQQAYSKIEKNPTRCSVERLNRIMELLEMKTIIPEDVVVYQEGKKNKSSNSENPDFSRNDISFLSKKLDVLIATMKELQMNMRIRNKP
jgi:transcriptional regulator with XRE-family HTH domain